MENKIIITTSVLEDVKELTPNLRQADINEVTALGSEPYKSLLKGFIFSDKCFSAKLQNKTIGMFGVSSYNMPKGFGVIWFLGSDECTKHPVTFVKQGIKYINKYLLKYDILLNIVDSRNTSHIKWLKAIGMTVTNPTNINNIKFYQFYKVKE